MSKEIIDPNSIGANTPDWFAGKREGYQQGKYDLNRIVALKEDLAYEKGLLAGHTKSICLIRHLQRTLSPHTDTGSQRKILEEAMELIAENIETNNNE